MNSEDFNRKKILVSILTIGSAVLLLGLMGTDIYSYFTSDIPIRIGVSLYCIPSLLIGHMILYVLIKKNRIRVVSFALTTLYSIGTVYGAYTWGVSMPTTLLLFSLVIGLIGMLFSSKKAFFATVITFILIFVLGLREIHNPAITSWKEYEVEIIDIISYIVIIGISSGLSLLSNNEIEKSLKRALESEKDLEIKVEKRTQELKQSQLETLSAMSRTYELGKLAQGLFHDLITPLNSAVLYVSEYERTQSKQYIEKAIEASNRMRRLIEVTKTQLKDKNNIEKFNVKYEIRITIDLLQYIARKKDVTIKVTGTETELTGIITKFNQVISNIVQNAIESFTTNGNTVTIHIEETTISISNNGPKIPDTVLKNIFDTSITTKVDHFGIGLPMIYHIMKEDFKGNIKVTSDANLTTFKLYFPDAKIHKTFPPVI